MKRVVIGICLVLLIVAGASLIPGWAQEAKAPANGGGAPPANPLKVALLKWYGASQLTTYDGALFEVGNDPYGVAFDGQCIWTANNGDGTVTKLRASDGTVLGTFLAGNLANGVAFDGQNIWVSGVFLVELKASDGSQVTYFQAASGAGVAFDGANVWAVGINSANVGKY